MIKLGRLLGSRLLPALPRLNKGRIRELTNIGGSFQLSIPQQLRSLHCTSSLDYGLVAESWVGVVRRFRADCGAKERNHGYAILAGSSPLGTFQIKQNSTVPLAFDAVVCASLLFEHALPTAY